MSEQRILCARFTAKPGREQEIERLLTELVERVRAEPGNTVFDAHRTEADHRAFFVYEVYRNAAAFEDHITADYGLAFNEALAELIEEDGAQLTWLERV